MQRDPKATATEVIKALPAQPASCFDIDDPLSAITIPQSANYSMASLGGFAQISARSGAKKGGCECSDPKTGFERSVCEWLTVEWCVSSCDKGISTASWSRFQVLRCYNLSKTIHRTDNAHF
jgi:hypothetical protein